MNETRPVVIRFFLLTVLALSSSVSQCLAYYHPDEGRWLSRDPIEEQGGINEYCFVLNGPIFLDDPLGLTSASMSDSITAGMQTGYPSTVSTL